jgi:hypothetical protein
VFCFPLIGGYFVDCANINSNYDDDVWFEAYMVTKYNKALLGYAVMNLTFPLEYQMLKCLELNSSEPRDLSSHECAYLSLS